MRVKNFTESRIIYFFGGPRHRLLLANLDNCYIKVSVYNHDKWIEADRISRSGVHEIAVGKNKIKFEVIGTNGQTPSAAWGIEVRVGEIVTWP